MTCRQSVRSPTRARTQAFAALANCGFPEAAHNRTALAICGTFARQAGFTWAGGLALGAGQGIVNGVPLEELGGRGDALRESLDLAAEALALGGDVPPGAVALMGRTHVPPFLYRWLGGASWRRQAREHGVGDDLKARPYA